MERVDENIAVVGKVLKPHGVNGEVTIAVTNDALFDANCMIIPIDGLFVPFFVESRRSKSDTVDIVKFEGVDSESDLAPLLGASVYMKKADIPDADNDYHTLEGYTIYNGDTLIGEISYIDDQTINVLFVVKSVNGGEVLIPIVEEWINTIDHSDRTIKMTLPEGLISQ